MLSRVAWRGGTSLGSLGLFLAAADLPECYRRGLPDGLARTQRAVMDALGFDAGASSALSAVARLGARSGAARYLVPLAAGLAEAGLTDWAIGDDTERLLRKTYKGAWEKP